MPSEIILGLVRKAGIRSLLTDNQNTYIWNVYGSMATVTPTNGTAVNATYDALGRMVEQQRGSTYTQILYSPVGKTALMNGSTLIKAFVPLPGGGTAIYNSSGLAYYRHPDWLGSSRLSSTQPQSSGQSSAMYSSTAYAPFGEQYATSGAADPSFTGQNSDTVSSLYDFTFREQSMNQGRWISPDPAGTAAVNPTNPQTWNRYAYVATNPLSYVDSLGLYQPFPGQCDNPEGDACGGGGGGMGGYFCDAADDCYVPGFVTSGTVAPGSPITVNTGFNSNGWPIVSAPAVGNASWSWTVAPGQFGPNALTINPDGTGSFPGDIYCGSGGACEIWDPSGANGQGQWELLPLPAGDDSAPSDVQAIESIFSQSVSEMVNMGVRGSGSGVRNNLQSWYKGYWGCGDQANYLKEQLQASGPSNWTYVIQGVNPILGVYTHYITIALPAYPGNPAIFMDPWANEITP